MFYDELATFLSVEAGNLEGQSTKSYLEKLWQELEDRIYIHQNASLNMHDYLYKACEVPPLLPENVLEAMRNLQIEIAKVIGGVPEQHMERMESEARHGEG